MQTEQLILDNPLGFAVDDFSKRLAERGNIIDAIVELWLLPIKRVAEQCKSQRDTFGDSQLGAKLYVTRTDLYKIAKQIKQYIGTEAAHSSTG